MDNLEDHFFDKDRDLAIKNGGNLPHWFQFEKLQYITFRLADSLPQIAINEITQKILIFKENNPEPWSDQTLQEFRRLLYPTLESYLDKGYGECILRHPEIRQIVERTIIFKDGIDYNVIAYVIMPNHIHLILIPLNDKNLSDILKDIKSISAHKINSFLGRKGKLWQKESFDRIVRTRDNFKHYIKYIFSNPRNLHEGEYSLYFNNPYGL